MEYIDAVDADFRVFYGIDGVGDGYLPDDLSGPRFIRRCEQLIAYKGAVRMHAERIAMEDAEAADGNQHGGQVPGRGDGSGPATVPAEAAPMHTGFRGEPTTGFPPVFEVIKPSGT